MESAVFAASTAIQDGFLITCDPALIDRARVHEMISGTYWAEGIPRDVMDRAMDHSLVFGVLDGRSSPARQVGVARVISDFATFAYLADVFVEPSCRGLGLSKRLMAFILGHPRLQGLRRFCLMTRDAHGLYEQFGFAQRADGGRAFMEIARPGMYLPPGVAGTAGEPA
ncbi:MAG: GNAT family N-acetyltransferase [Phycisphaerales bacterium]